MVLKLGLTGARGVCMEGAPERKGKERKGKERKGKGSVILSSKSGFRGKAMAVLFELVQRLLGRAEPSPVQIIDIQMPFHFLMLPSRAMTRIS
jgi:hypothetical protein